MFNIPTITMVRNYDHAMGSAGSSHRGSKETSRKASRKGSPQPRGSQDLKEVGDSPRALPKAEVERAGLDESEKVVGVSPSAQAHTTTTRSVTRPPPLQSHLQPSETSDTQETVAGTSEGPAASLATSSEATTTTAKKTRGTPRLTQRSAAADTVVFALPRAKTTQDAIAQLRSIQTRRASSATSVSALASMDTVAEVRTCARPLHDSTTPRASSVAAVSPVAAVAGALTRIASSSATQLDELVPSRAASPQAHTPSATAASPRLSRSQPLPKGDLPATLHEFHTSPHYVVSLHAARQSVFDDALSGFRSYVAREEEEINMYWTIQTRRKHAQHPVTYERTMEYEGGISHVIATPVYKDPLEELQANMKDGDVLPASALFLMRSHDAHALHHHLTEATPEKEATLGHADVTGTVESIKGGCDEVGETGTHEETDAAAASSEPSKAQQELTELCEAELRFRSRLQERLYERQRIPLMFRRSAPPPAAAPLTGASRSTSSPSKPAPHPHRTAHTTPKEAAPKTNKKSPSSSLSSSDLASLAVLDHPPRTATSTTSPSKRAGPRAASRAKVREPILRAEWPYVYEQFQRDLHREVLLVNGTQYTTPDDAVAAIASFLDYCYTTGLGKVQHRAAAVTAKKEALKAKRGFFENLLDTVTTFADDVARAATGTSSDADPQVHVYSTDPARRGAQLFEATRQVVLAAQQSFMGFPYQLLCEQVGTERIALALEELEQEMDAWMTAAGDVDDEEEMSASLQSSLMGSPTWRPAAAPPGQSASGFEMAGGTVLRSPIHRRRPSVSGHSATVRGATNAKLGTLPAPLEIPIALRSSQTDEVASRGVSTRPAPFIPTVSSSLAEPADRTPVNTPLRLASSFAHTQSPRVLSPTMSAGAVGASASNRLVRLYRSSAARDDTRRHAASGVTLNIDAAHVPRASRSESSSSSTTSSSTTAVSQPTEEGTTVGIAMLVPPTSTETSTPNASQDALGEQPEGPAAGSNTASSEPPARHEDPQREVRRRRREEKRQQALQRRVKEKREEQMARMPLIVGEPPAAEFEKLLVIIRQAVRVRDAVDRAVKTKRDGAKKGTGQKSSVTPAHARKATKEASSLDPSPAPEAGKEAAPASPAAAAVSAEPMSWFREDVDGSVLLLPLDENPLLTSRNSDTPRSDGHVSDRAMRTYLYFNTARNIPMVCVCKVFRLFVMPGLEPSGHAGSDTAAAEDRTTTSATANATPDQKKTRRPSSVLADKSLLLLIQVQFSLFDEEDVHIRWRWWTV